MKRKFLKIFHIIALCIFIGSIPSHIVLGQLAEQAYTSDVFVAYHQAKYFLTVTLTGAGIALTLLSGILLTLSNLALLKANWLRAKLGLVALVTLNGALILTPAAEAMWDLALKPMATGSMSPEFIEIAGREALAGGLNQVLLLIILALAVMKPSLARRRPTTAAV